MRFTIAVKSKYSDCALVRQHIEAESEKALRARFKLEGFGIFSDVTLIAVIEEEAGVDYQLVRVPSDSATGGTIYWFSKYAPKQQNCLSRLEAIKTLKF